MVRLLLLGAAGIVLSGSVALAGSVKLGDTQLNAFAGGAGTGGQAGSPGGGVTVLRTDVSKLAGDLRNHASLSVLQGDFQAIRTDVRNLRH